MSIHDKIAKDAHREGMRLVCGSCAATRSLSRQQFAEYLARGWPLCCGYTMGLETAASPSGARKE